MNKNIRTKCETEIKDQLIRITKLEESLNNKNNTITNLETQLLILRSCSPSHKQSSSTHSQSSLTLPLLEIES
jgi:predicted RNase H-like nuclease (RuvC/YqgF family)